MKRNLLKTTLMAALLTLGGNAAAQAQVKAETEKDVYPQAYIGVAGGGFFQLTKVGYDVKNTFTPMGAFNLGGWFNPWLGARFQFTGWKERGMQTNHLAPERYEYGFMSPNLDLMIDVTNLLCKKPHVVHASVLGGVGFSAGRGDNTLQSGYVTKSNRFTVNYRVGAQVEAKVNRTLGIFVEGVAINMHECHRPALTKKG